VRSALHLPNPKLFDKQPPIREPRIKPDINEPVDDVKQEIVEVRVGP
jgi:hypothetical protein